MRTDDTADRRLRIRDLVDLDRLRRLLEGFSEVAGIAVALLDHPDPDVLVGAGCRDVCTKYLRSHPAAWARCGSSYRRLVARLASPGEAVVERCENGLVVCATPVVMGGRHLATLATGQLLLEPPDRERFRRQAEELGFEPAAYLRAVDELPIVSESRLRRTTLLLGEVAGLVSEMGQAYLAAREEGDRVEASAAEAARMHEARSAVLLEVAELADRPRQEICDFCLEESLEITRSRIGYLAFLNDDESVLAMNSWSRSAMAECAIGDKPILYPVVSTGLWGEAVRQRKPIVTNDYGAPSPLKKGHPPGHVRLERHMNVPIFDGGRIVLVAGVANKPQDYTPADVVNLTLLMQGLWRLLERKRAREALRLKDLVFDRALTANSTAGADGVLTEANEAFLRTWGLSSRDDAVGRSIADFLADPEEVREILGALDRLGSWRGRFAARRRDGSTFVAEGLATTLTDGEGRLVGYQSSVLDVSERVAAEERTRLQSEMLDAAPVGIMVHGGDGAFLYANRNAAEMHGYTAETVRLSGLPDLVPPEDRARCRERIAQVEREGSASFEVQHLRRDGSRFYVQVSAKRVEWQGKPAVLSVQTDLSERRRAEAERRDLEEQLRASQKMEAVGLLAGGISHDFNNLLSVILSYARFAIDRLPEGEPARSDLLEVWKAGERAATLVRQLLAFSRKQVLQVVPVNLNHVCAGVEKMLRRILGEDIEYVQVLAPGLGLTLADPGQLEQVLVNLVVNARDAMPQGGKLVIETSNVELEEEVVWHRLALRPGPYVQLVVTDSGCGLDAWTRARIFEPFFTTKPRGKGTGLGLSTVYGIVKQSGGDISVHSEVGRGTTFQIYLPRVASAAGEATVGPAGAAAAHAAATGTETLLVVEDEEALRRAAARALEAAGYTVLTAASAEEALETAAAHAGDIHLLLTDVVMPGRDGRALARELAKARPSVEVVYMSGHTDDAIAHRGVLDAGLHFLAKPFTGADVTRKVREVLDGDTTRRAGEGERAIGTPAEGEERPLEEAGPRELAADVVTELREAVVAGRHRDICRIVEVIRITQPNLATRLRRMVDRFDYEGLRDLLDR